MQHMEVSCAVRPI